MVIKSLQHLKRILADGRIRRLYIAEDGLKKLAYYILFVPEQKRYIIFFCNDGREESVPENIFMNDQYRLFRELIREGKILVDL